MFRFLRVIFWGVAGVAFLASVAAGAANAEGAWTKNSRMEEGRVLIQAASNGTDVYIAGGSTLVGPRASFDLYDTATDMWRPLPPMPTARERFGMAGFSGRIYISGGRSREMDETSPKPSDALWAYDTVSGDWVVKASMPSERVDHAMVSIGDHLYVIGGTGEHADLIYIYNVVTDLWTTSKTRTASPRRNFGVAYDDTSIFIIGGISSDGRVRSAIDVFDTGTQTWEAQAPLPKPRVGVAAAVIQGRLHVAGGSTPDPAQTFNEHFSRGAGETSWRKELGLPTARHTTAYAVAGGKWFVIGGGAAAGFYTLFSAADAVEAFNIN